MEELTTQDYKEAIESTQSLVREIDYILNGEGMAKQASLCDLVHQIKELKAAYEKANIN